jgi:hypothetical protein
MLFPCFTLSERWQDGAWSGAMPAVPGQFQVSFLPLLRLPIPPLLHPKHSLTHPPSCHSGTHSASPFCLKQMQSSLSLSLSLPLVSCCRQDGQVAHGGSAMRAVPRRFQGGQVLQDLPHHALVEVFADHDGRPACSHCQHGPHPVHCTHPGQKQRDARAPHPDTTHAHVRADTHTLMR